MKHVYSWSFFGGRLWLCWYPRVGDWKLGVRRFNSWLGNRVIDLDLGPLKIMV
jgi:hypothetical protein